MGYSYQTDRNGNPYAHYNANALDQSQISNLFSLQKTKNMLAAQSKKLKTAQIKNLTKTNNVTTKDALKILKNLEDTLKTGGVGTSADIKTGSSKLVGDLSAYGLAKDIPKLLEKSNLSEFNNAISEMVKEAEKIVNGPALDSLIESYLQENPNIIFSAEGKELPQNVKTWINKVIAKGSSPKENSLTLFKTKSGNPSNDKEAVRLLTLVKIINTVMKKEGFQSKDNLETISQMMHYLAISLSRFGGSMNEVLIRESVEGLESSILTNLNASLSGSNYVPIVQNGKKISLSQAKRQGVVSKADVLVSYNFQKEVDGNQISIKMKTPIGISAKKVGNPDIKNISLSSGSTLGAVLSRCEDINRNEKYYLFNIMANTKIQQPDTNVSSYGKVGKRTDLSGSYGLAKNYLSAANILNSLVGTLTKKDMSYFFIVNDKVYRTTEIIQLVIEGKINLKMNISPAYLGSLNNYLLKNKSNLKNYNKGYSYKKSKTKYAKDRQMSLLRSENLYAQYINSKVNTKLNYGKSSGAERLGF